MLSLANLITDGRTLYGHEGALHSFLTGLTGAFVRLGPLALVYFGFVFPETLPLDRRFPWIKWFVIGPMLIRAGFVGTVAGLALHHANVVARLWPIALAVSDVGTDIELGLVGLFFLILGYKTVTAGSRDARRRFVLLDTGAAVGLLPLLLTQTWDVIHHIQFRGWPDSFDRSAACVPLSNGLRHRRAPCDGCARSVPGFADLRATGSLGFCRSSSVWRS